MKKFEKTIKSLCSIDLKRTDLDSVDRTGAIGVACVLSYLNGVKPSVEDLARSLGMTVEEIHQPYQRLLSNGFFSTKDAKQDEALWSETISWDTQRTAWCYVAGISAGLTGLRD